MRQSVKTKMPSTAVNKTSGEKIKNRKHSSSQPASQRVLRQTLERQTLERQTLERTKPRENKLQRGQTLGCDKPQRPQILGGEKSQRGTNPRGDKPLRGQPQRIFSSSILAFFNSRLWPFQVVSPLSVIASIALRGRAWCSIRRGPSDSYFVFGLQFL